ncbi:MAG TPA: hypothetical protein DCL41_02985 [Bdellovibrionales bacterium]|nr:hypothetical protein [Pseudobdellovibrionaceae bacterium]HAG90806.1 hypothetical protein [Bdellovibrionales bacterium]|tara:strand:+ start:239 stop:1063 length:825 start_codon:yes stop_codon:yes gene_type:complete
MEVFKNIIRRERAEEEVLAFEPRVLELELSDSAKVYLNEDNRKKSDFVMADLMAKQTGVEEVESQSHKDMVEQEVLERLKEVQEATYQEAFALGKEEGSKQAFEAVKAELEEKISQFGELIEQLRSLRSEVLKHHEKEIIEMVFSIGKKIALKDLSEDSSVIKDLVEELVDESEKDEEIKIFLSPHDHAFVSEQISSGNFKFPDLNRLKLISKEAMTSGGCLVQTRFGSIDSQVEQRVENAWLALQGKLPRTDDTVVEEDPVSDDNSGSEEGES